MSATMTVTSVRCSRKPRCCCGSASKRQERQRADRGAHEQEDDGQGERAAGDQAGEDAGEQRGHPHHEEGGVGQGQVHSPEGRRRGRPANGVRRGRRARGGPPYTWHSCARSARPGPTTGEVSRAGRPQARGPAGHRRPTSSPATSRSAARRSPSATAWASARRPCATTWRRSRTRATSPTRTPARAASPPTRATACSSTGCRTVKPLSGAERRAIQSFLEGAVDLDDVVRRTVRLLAQLTHQVAVVQYPSLSRSAVRHLEIVHLAPNRLLLVLITDTGRVEQRVLELPAALSRGRRRPAAARRSARGCTARRLVDVPGRARRPARRRAARDPPGAHQRHVGGARDARRAARGAHRARRHRQPHALRARLPAHPAPGPRGARGAGRAAQAHRRGQRPDDGAR